MTWGNKAKVQTETPSFKILTPDGNRIIVGSSAKYVLIYSTSSSEWTKKSKTNTEPWSNKSKVIS